MGETEVEVCALIRVAIGFFTETLAEEGQPMPTSQSHRLIKA